MFDEKKLAAMLTGENTSEEDCELLGTMREVMMLAYRTSVTELCKSTGFGSDEDVESIIDETLDESNSFDDAVRLLDVLFECSDLRSLIDMTRDEKSKSIAPNIDWRDAVVCASALAAMKNYMSPSAITIVEGGDHDKTVWECASRVLTAVGKSARDIQKTSR